MRTHCKIPDCGKPSLAQDLCSAHYTRWKRYGDPLFVKRAFSPPAPIRERFERFIEREEGGCWLWQGTRIPSGYGYFTVSSGVKRTAQRVSWELFRGPIPDGMHIDHLCRNRGCVNPDHLEPVTPNENWRRGFSPTAVNKQKAVCQNGHPLDEANTYVDARGYRRCRICTRVHRRTQTSALP